MARLRGLHPEVQGSILLVGEVGEAREPQRVGVIVLRPVVLVDVAEVVPEDLEPAALLPEPARDLAVLRPPLIVHLPHLLLRPLRRGVPRQEGGGEEEEADQGPDSSHLSLLRPRGLDWGGGIYDGAAAGAGVVVVL